MTKILLATESYSLSKYLKEYIKKKKYYISLAKDINDLEKKLNEDSFDIVCFSEPFVKESYEDDNLNHMLLPGEANERVTEIIENRRLLTEKIIITYDEKLVKGDSDDEWICIGRDLKEKLDRSINKKLVNKNDKFNRIIVALNLLFTSTFTLSLLFLSKEFSGFLFSIPIILLLYFLFRYPFHTLQTKLLIPINIFSFNILLFFIACNSVNWINGQNRLIISSIFGLILLASLVVAFSSRNLNKKLLWCICILEIISILFLLCIFIKYRFINNIAIFSYSWDLWILLSIFFMAISLAFYFGRKSIFSPQKLSYHFVLQTLILIIIIIIQGFSIIDGVAERFLGLNIMFSSAATRHSEPIKGEFKLDYFYPEYSHEGAEENIVIHLNNFSDSLYLYSYHLNLDTQKAFLKDASSNICSRDSLKPHEQKAITFPLKIRKSLKEKQIEIDFSLNGINEKLNRPEKQKIVIKIIKKIPYWIVNWWKQILAVIGSTLLILLKDQISSLLKGIVESKLKREMTN